MRAKIILPVFALACAVVALLLWPNFFHAENPLPPLPAESVAIKTNSPEFSAAAPAVPSPTSAAPAAISPPADPSRMVEELRSLALNNDADSLKTILSELTNASPEIRAAAREAAVQFGDRSATPALRAAAAMVESPQEKVALLDAADFLDQPALEVNSVTNPYPSKKYSQPAPTAQNPPMNAAQSP